MISYLQNHFWMNGIIHPFFFRTAEEWHEIKWAKSFENVQKLRYCIDIQTQRTIKDPSKDNLRKLSLLQEKMLFSYDNLVHFFYFVKK